MNILLLTNSQVISQINKMRLLQFVNILLIVIYLEYKSLNVQLWEPFVNTI